MQDWLAEVHGEAPLVVYAPHGGRRDAVAGRGASVNDLHTDAMALGIARRLGAGAVVNRGLDRNLCDLNRIATLKREQASVLARLRSAIDVATQGGRRPALVLLLHGWNTSAPWCDVGVGLTESCGELRGRNPTVSRHAYDRVCTGLVVRLRAAGLEASIGHRYAASGRDNVTQLFSGRHAADDDRAVAGLSSMAAAGMIDGVQLELGIPLRWPGAHRDTFLDVLCDVLAAESRDRRAGACPVSARAEWSLPPRRIDRAGDRPEHGYALQAALSDGSGLFFGAEPTGARSMAARVCLARPGGAMSLFVAEGPWGGALGRYHVAGLRFDAAASAGADAGTAFDASMVYRGPVVRYATHDAFLDLERGLAAADIEEAVLDLRYVHHDTVFGTLHGRIRIGQERIEIAATAVSSRGSRLEPAAGSRLRVHITDRPHGPRALAASSADAEARSVELSQDGARIVCSREAADLDGRVVARVPVYRTLPDGSALRVTFGVAEFETIRSGGGARGMGPASYGLFEEVVVLRR